MGTQRPSPKGGGAPSPIFGQFLLWPNGWMHQDATWYGCRPRPRGLCVTWRPSPPPQKGGGAPPPTKISAHVYCGQTAGWIKMPLVTKVGLSPGDSVLDRDPAPVPTKGVEPYPKFFGLFLLWPNGGMHQDATWYGGRPRPTRHCVRCRPSYRQKKRAAHPLHPIFGPCLLWPNGWMDEDAAWYGSRPPPRPHCTRRGSSSHKRGTATPLFSAHVYCGHGRPSQLLLSSCFGYFGNPILSPKIRTGKWKMYTNSVSLTMSTSCLFMLLPHLLTVSTHHS